jgi:endonuclease YncB( thermonuclease family)
MKRYQKTMGNLDERARKSTRAAVQRLILVLLMSLPIAPLGVFAETMSGAVVGVLDGDTIEVLRNNQPERIRLNGIDCPLVDPHSRAALGWRNRK